ncbi:ABC-type nitrate/sulfonate/bicarbonate transport system permease component [Neobacillus niacini]|uniref:hypothetical protein n=1 Tax=Neobacillus niacini TaxID=86668 RepID=UPI002866608D|nr:hypothetical protein [Neobacillus niacini]MDR7080274.1 ABC-type nitrate/sulfonate/bicarbonate transport system permease component [Neobacillus niacini]
MKKKSNKLLLLVVSQIIFLILLIGLMEVLIRAGILNSFYFPAPSNILMDIFQLFTDESIWVHVYTTLIEFIAGYALAILLGISIGMFLVLVPWAEESFNPLSQL